MDGAVDCPGPASPLQGALGSLLEWVKSAYGEGVVIRREEVAAPRGAPGNVVLASIVDSAQGRFSGVRERCFALCILAPRAA